MPTRRGTESRPAEGDLPRQHEWETLEALLGRSSGDAPSADSVRAMLWIVVEACEAVTRAHGRGVVHGALEPRNVMVERDRQRILILGARSRAAVAPPAEARSSGRPADRRAHSAAYMAPEQAWGRDDDLDARTDVYGIGGILHAILFGKPPHDGGSLDADLVLAKRGVVAGLDGAGPEHALLLALWHVARRALSADPGQRYPSALLLQADVARALEHHGGIA